MAYATSFVEIGESSMDLAKLPLFSLYVLGNGIGRKEGFGTLCTPGEGVKALLRFRVEPNGKGFRHTVCLIVY